MKNCVLLIGDGLKITAPIFDSLKFSKQATKRSLRENIRESVEKMRVVISVFLLGLLIGCAPLFSQQDSLVFPGNWAGEWTGDLVISTSAGEVQRLPMILRILPQEDLRYSFTIVYGEDTPENTRPYFLETIDANEGHYVTDEENSILLDDYLINGKLYSRFEVMGNLLLSTLEEREGHLIYEIISGPLAPVRTTGDTIMEGEEIPPVNSYQVKVQQRAVLKRKKGE